MKNRLFIFSLLITFLSCKKDKVEPEAFVSFYTKPNSKYFYQGETVKYEVSILSQSLKLKEITVYKVIFSDLTKTILPGYPLQLNSEEYESTLEYTLPKLNQFEPFYVFAEATDEKGNQFSDTLFTVSHLTTFKEYKNLTIGIDKSFNFVYEAGGSDSVVDPYYNIDTFYTAATLIASYKVDPDHPENFYLKKINLGPSIENLVKSNLEYDSLFNPTKIMSEYTSKIKLDSMPLVYGGIFVGKLYSSHDKTARLPTYGVFKINSIDFTKVNTLNRDNYIGEINIDLKFYLPN